MQSNRVASRNAFNRRCLKLIGAIALMSGCAAHNAEFSIDDRPLIQKNGETCYALHVGDQPTLRLRTKFMSCDYAILHDGTKDAYDDCGPALASGFEWPYRFDRCTGQQPARLSVRAYRRGGMRDYMPYGEELLQNESMRDPLDALAATASLLVYVYQSEVNMKISLPEGKPIWRLSRLILTGDNGRQTRVRYKKEPEEGSFMVEGPDEAGEYRVRYGPSISEINRSGPTPVELIVADESGETTTFTREDLSLPIDIL